MLYNPTKNKSIVFINNELRGIAVSAKIFNPHIARDKNLFYSMEADRL